MKRSHIISFVVSGALLILAFPKANELLGAQRATSPWFYVTLASTLVFAVSLIMLLEDIFPWLRSEGSVVSELGVRDGSESGEVLRARYEGLSNEELHFILDGESYSQTAQEVAIAILREREQEWSPCSKTCPCEHYFPPPTAACRVPLGVSHPHRKDEDLTDPVHRD